MDRVPRPMIEGLEEDLLPLIEDRRDAALKNILVNLHPADVAAVIASLAKEEAQRYLFDLIADPETASDVLVELPIPARENVLEDISHDELADLLEEMESDDAADVVQELPEEAAQQVLSVIEPEELAQVRPLLVHPADSAGGIMASEALTVDVEGTIGSARDLVRSTDQDLGPFFYMFVIDRERKLRGVLSLKDLVLRTSPTPIREAMDSDPITIPPDMDQEQVADIFRRYNLFVVPVVDREGTFLGRITVDDVVDVMREEAEEDLARMAGTVEEEFDEPSVRKVSLLRLPWILVSLFGGLLAGGVLRHFTGVVGEVALVLIVFVPVITAMGGNAGSQAAITMVRRLTVRRIGAMEIGSIVLREARVGLLLGLMCGVIVGGVAYAVEGTWFYGAVVGVAMTAAILVAATMGALVPLMFHFAKVDPAIATGPFVSMSNDVTGLFIYFGLAALLLRLGATFVPG